MPFLRLEGSALRWCWKTLVLLVLGITVTGLHGQGLPNTSGETLSGKSIVLADAVRGHAAVLVVGFGKEAGDGCAAWAKALLGDPALSGVVVYQVFLSADGRVRWRGHGMAKDSEAQLRTAR
jgi:hypothetical protein